MAKFILVATISAQPGRDADYNTWYDTQHIRDLLAISGVVSARRFAAASASPNDPPSDYLAIYEIETDDPATIIAELKRRGAAGEMSRTDAIDPASARLWLWAERAPLDTPGVHAAD